MTHGVAILVFEGVQAIDVFGPSEAFATATSVLAARRAEHDFYRIELISERGRLIRTSSGIGIKPHGNLEPNWGDFQTLVVPGGTAKSIERACGNPAIIDTVLAAHRKKLRLAAISEGVEVLAAAGLLGGRWVTTHWQSAARLDRRYPDLHLAEQEIWHQDEEIFSSAGATAGINLALELVSQDIDREIAVETARNLVFPMERKNGQLVYGDLLAMRTSSARIDALLDWLDDRPRPKLTVADLAHRCNMKTREFRGRLKDELDMTPSVLLERARLTWARQMLEQHPPNLAKVARECGFPSVDAMRRAFRKHCHCTPTEYGEKFVRRPGSAP